MSNNPQAKTAYLDKQKAEMHNLKKLNQKFQEEVGIAKKGEERAKKKLEDIVDKHLVQFGNNLCKVLEMPPVQVDARKGHLSLT